MFYDLQASIEHVEKMDEGMKNDMLLNSGIGIEQEMKNIFWIILNITGLILNLAFLSNIEYTMPRLKW